MQSTSISKKASQIAELQDVYALVEADFQAVNQLIPAQLTSDVALVEEIGHYIVESGGKRLRPLMVLLASGALQYRGSEHIKLAAIIEFLHTATLLHDDVVDRSDMRRGRATANQQWGNAPSVLVGDFLYSRAFQLMVDVGNMPIMGVLSSATNTIAEGEVMQLANIGNLEMDESQYREVIRCKTALLFEAATHTGALLAHHADTENVPHSLVEHLQNFGRHFGMTYQLVDDYLDYAGSAEAMGKNVGDDLAEGKLTLPLIYALSNADADDAQIVRTAIQEKSLEYLDEIVRIVNSCGALQYTHEAAVTEAKLAIECLAPLPQTPYLEALTALTNYSTARLF